MLALRIDDHIESPSNGTNFRKDFKRSDVYREPVAEVCFFSIFLKCLVGVCHFAQGGLCISLSSRFDRIQNNLNFVSRTKFTEAVIFIVSSFL